MPPHFLWVFMVCSRVHFVIIHSLHLPAISINKSVHKKLCQFKRENTAAKNNFVEETSIYESKIPTISTHRRTQYVSQ